jgi:hypothetical protein
MVCGAMTREEVYPAVKFLMRTRWLSEEEHGRSF